MKGSCGEQKDRFSAKKDGEKTTENHGGTQGKSFQISELATWLGKRPGLTERFSYIANAGRGTLLGDACEGLEGKSRDR